MGCVTWRAKNAWNDTQMACYSYAIPRDHAAAITKCIKAFSNIWFDPAIKLNVWDYFDSFIQNLNILSRNSNYLARDWNVPIFMCYSAMFPRENPQSLKWLHVDFDMRCCDEQIFFFSLDKRSLGANAAQKCFARFSSRLTTERENINSSVNSAALKRGTGGHREQE